MSDDSIDFGKWFRKKSVDEISPEDALSPEGALSSSDLKIGAKNALFSLQKHQKLIIPIVLLLFLVWFGFHLRALPFSLPVADTYAQNAVHNYYRDQISQGINKQFPNLPSENRQKQVDAEFTKFLSQNKELVQQQIDGNSESFRRQFQDNSGQVYLLGIDPYYYFRQMRNVLAYGTVGTEVKDGKPFDSYKLAPIGQFIDSNLHPYVGVLVHKIMSMFSDISLMGSFLYVGAIISALSAIPAFFIGRKIGGNVGGFFAGWAVVANIFFVKRTAGESSDTDAYNIFFPLLIVWVFLEALDQKDLRKRAGLSAVCGALVGLYAFAWTGWWFVLYFVLGATLCVIIYQIALGAYQHRSLDYHRQILRDGGIIFSVLLISSFVFTMIFTDLGTVYRAIRGPFGFLTIKSVGTIKIWPNVLTTVAELNPLDISDAIAEVGGPLLVILATLGILLSGIRKKNEQYDITYLVLFGMWLVVSLWSTKNGTRFTLLAVPAVGVGFGFFCGLLYQYAVRWLGSMFSEKSRIVARGVLALFIAIIFIGPVFGNYVPPASYTMAYGPAKSSLPSMNDGWFDALTKIKDTSDSSAIITSWWDFGHWFKAVADRSVTFDGGSQNTPQAHWVGKMLLTSNESVSFGIMRMLDCGGNFAFESINSKLQNPGNSVKLVNDVILSDKRMAAKVLSKHGFTASEIDNITAYTHCSPPEGYVIASDDMIGKAGVWGHFGAWNFDKSEMVLKARNLPYDDAIAVLISDFNLSAEAAESTYKSMMKENPNNWIAPWPGYEIRRGLFHPCVVQDNLLICRINLAEGQATLNVNLFTKDAFFSLQDGQIRPTSLVYPTREGISSVRYDGRTTGFSVILIPSGNNYRVVVSDPLQAESMFTRLYFYSGHGLSCFDPFDHREEINGGGIFTYKMDWGCSSLNNVFSIPDLITMQPTLGNETAASNATQAAIRNETIAPNSTGRTVIDNETAARNTTQAAANNEKVAAANKTQSTAADDNEIAAPNAST